MLRAYNAEAENCVKTVKAGNLTTAQNRPSKVREQIMRQGDMINLRVRSEYHGLRLEEPSIAAEHLQRMQAEKEEERARKAELREERQAAAELAREREKLDKEKRHYESTIVALLAKGDHEGVARTQLLLDEAQRRLG